MPRPAVFKNAKRINLTLDDEILKKAKKVAKENNKTVSEIIRDILRDHFDGSLIGKRKDLSHVIERITKMRESLPKSKTDSAEIIRAWRNGNWKEPLSDSKS